MNNSNRILQIKILNPKIGTTIPFPRYETNGSAGMDLRACLDGNLTIYPGETQLLPSGIAVHIVDPGYAGMVLPRSGLGHKHGIVLGNLVGLIDSDYQGEIMLSCWNRGKEPFLIEVGTRVAQLILVAITQVQLKVVTEFQQSTIRGDSGFGHTGRR
jgi:dUTP pyrophosphatase